MESLKTVPLRWTERGWLSLRPGDILACEGGEPGRCAVWEQVDSPITFQKALHRIRVRDPRAVSPSYVAYALREAIQSRRCDFLFTGTTIKHLPQEKLRRIEMPIPLYERQLKFVAHADELRSQATRTTEALVRTTRRSGALRRALLAAAFSGRLTGGHTDDEVIEEMAQ